MWRNGGAGKPGCCVICTNSNAALTNLNMKVIVLAALILVLEVKPVKPCST